jgi:hypothetical protein
MRPASLEELAARAKQATETSRRLRATTRRLCAARDRELARSVALVAEIVAEARERSPQRTDPEGEQG